MRILYIQSTLVPPPIDQNKDRFLLLSRELEGDILQPVWFRKPAEIEAMFGPGSYPVYTVGRFRYHWFLVGSADSNVLMRLATFWFYLKTGVRICRGRGTQCIVGYSHLTTGLCAVLLKAATRTRLIIELMTAPEKIYLIDTPKPNIWKKLRHLYSNICLYITVLASDRVHLLSPGALRSYPVLRNKPVSVFHDYTPLAEVQLQDHADENNQRILLAGYPWYLKGVDLAIEAFRRVAPDFPHAKLTIASHAPDGAPQKMAAGCPAIEVLGATPHDQLMQMVSEAAVMLLPSRNEGLGRVLIEGMAAGLPLVGSDVGGIPSLIKDGENGFLFPVGDIDALERCLRRLLSDADLRRKMGRRSHELFLAGLTEAAYAERFVEMVGRVG